MNKIKKILFLLVICHLIKFFLISSILNYHMNIINTYNREFDNLIKTSDYEVISNITIFGNNEWEMLQSTYGWCTGNGTWNNPYIIENIAIRSQSISYCVDIQETNVSFIIRNCDFNSHYLKLYSINLVDVRNGVIQNNSFNNFEFNCVILNNCYNLTILRNSISGSRMKYEAHTSMSNGVSLSNSNETQIIENIIFYNHNGISFWNSSHNTISGNSIRNNENYGISISESNQINISNNRITNNDYYGLSLLRSNYCFISNNQFIENIVGCYIERDSIGNVFENNICVNYINPLLILIITIVSIVVITITMVILYKKAKSKLFKGSQRKLQKIVKKRLNKEISEIQSLFDQNKFEIAINKFDQVKEELKPYDLPKISQWIKRNESFFYESAIRNTILQLGTKSSRINLNQISKKSGVKNSNIILKVVQEMIEAKEIYGEYFSSTKTILFDQKANIREIDNLMKMYREWEENKTAKKM